MTNHARIPSYALNFVGISEGQELNISVVNAEPYLDLYELARLLVGAEPLSIALYGAFQLGCHLEHILLTISLTIKSHMPVILCREDEEHWLMLLERQSPKPSRC